MKSIITLFFLCVFSIVNAQENLSEIDSLANYWQGMGKYDKALLYANKSLEINQKSKIDTAVEESLYRLAAIHSDMDEFEKSEKIYLDVLQRMKIRNAKKYFGMHRVLEGLGVLYMRMGAYEEAEKRMQEAANLAKEIAGKENDIYALDLILLGQIAYYQGQYEKGIDWFLKAQRILEKYLPKSAHDYGVVLGSLATLYSALGQYELAEPVYEKSLKIAEETSGKKHEYLTGLNNIAFLYFDMGDYEKAEAFWLEAIELAGHEDMLGKSHSVYADYLVSLAGLYLNMQRYEEAEQIYKTGLNIYAENLGTMHDAYASCLNNLAVLYHRTDRKKEAEEFYKKALEISLKTLGKDHPSYAAQLSNLAAVLGGLERYKEAEALFQQVLTIYKKVLGEDHPSYADALVSLGMLHQSNKNFISAKKNFEQAATIFRNKFGVEHPSYAESLNRLGDLYLDQNQIDSSKLFCLASFAANSPDSIPVQAVSDLYQLDKYSYYSEVKTITFFETLLKINKKEYENSKNKTLLEEGYLLAQAAVRFGDNLKNNFQAAGNKLQLLKTTHVFAAHGVDAAFQLQEKKHLEQAFSLAEHNKSILLADATKAQRARSMGDLPDSLALKEMKIQENLMSLKKQELEAKGEEKKMIGQALGELHLEMDALKKELEKKYPKYFKIKYAQTTAKAEEIKQLLDDKTLFLEYFIGDSTLYLFALTKDDLKLKALKVNLKELKQKIADLRRALTDYDFIVKEENTAQQLYTRTAYWFYQNIFAPALPQGKDIQSVIVVTDGELGHLPFEAFLTESVQSGGDYKKLPYLVNQYKISYNYSATLWKENFETAAMESLPRLNGKMLAMAASYKVLSDGQQQHSTRAPHLRTLREGLQDLPAAKAEVEVLSKIFVGDFLQGDSSNELYFKEKAKDYSVIHLAMHGLLNQRAPILSSLAFTENGDTIEDNFLEAWEIAHLKLNAQLIVLSACETGYGKFEQGEGVMSLARSFMYAGVPSLVVSLWQVNDFSTSAIMEFFYQNLAAGMDKAEALQKAKMQYLEKAEGVAAHPAFWAAFVQLGDTRPVALQTKSSSFWIYAIGAFAVLGIGIFGAIRMRKK